MSTNIGYMGLNLNTMKNRRNITQLNFISWSNGSSLVKFLYCLNIKVCDSFWKHKIIFQGGKNVESIIFMLIVIFPIVLFSISYGFYASFWKQKTLMQAGWDFVNVIFMFILILPNVCFMPNKNFILSKGSIFFCR